MARAQKEPLRPLTAEEYQALERVSKASSERVDTARRARALQTVAQGHPFAHAAREAGFRSVTTVANLVSRFNQRGRGALRIATGRGRRVTYGTEARARIVAVAQQEPQRRADQTATWSLSTLQRRLRRDGLPQVGATTIRRVLHDAGSAYQRTRTWCPTGTALRTRTDGPVRVIDPLTEEKKPNRPGLSAGRGGRRAGVVSGRGRSVPSDPAAGSQLAAGGAPRLPAP